MRQNMYLMDYHMHSDSSPDGKDSLCKMCEAAIQKNIDEICITDHCDCNGFPGTDFIFDYKKSKAEYLKAKELYGNKIKIKFGIEVGQITQAEQVGKEILQNDFDFVLGSLHNIKGYDDFYNLKYISINECKAMFESYTEELIIMTKMLQFDCLAHLNYPTRYALMNYGYDVGFNMFEEQIREIFKILIENGKGLEANTSAYRYGMPITWPGEWELKLFKEMGGEIVTIGSDSHKKEHFGYGIREGQMLLKEIGFKYIAAYKQRTPSFISI